MFDGSAGSVKCSVFADEHASLTHTWTQGTLESGLRAVREMLRGELKFADLP